MFNTLGFIAVVAAGLYLLVIGILSAWFDIAFIGKPRWISIGLMVLGGGILVALAYFNPLGVSVRVGQ
jgi:hypothetical protein